MTTIVRNGPLPRYYQLKEIIREKVRSGDWPPGQPIPSERELSEQYGISRMTVRQSVSALVNEGLLFREQGRGTFVDRPKIAQQLLRLTGFSEDIEARQQLPGARVLEAAMWPCDETIAARLRIKPGQPVFHVRRLRLADAEPLALETSIVSFIGCERLLDEDLERDSLYRLLETTYHQPLLEAEQEVEAGLAGAHDAEALGIAPGDPVLLTRRLTFTERQRPIEYAISVYRGDKYTYCARLVRDGRVA
jgi:GntR family transcriptional regulator